MWKRQWLYPRMFHVFQTILIIFLYMRIFNYQTSKDVKFIKVILGRYLMQCLSHEIQPLGIFELISGRYRCNWKPRSAKLTVWSFENAAWASFLQVYILALNLDSARHLGNYNRDEVLSGNSVAGFSHSRYGYRLLYFFAVYSCVRIHFT